MNDLFNSALAQWFHLETQAVKAAEAVKNNKEDLEFYAQLVSCASEQAEVAAPSDLEAAVRYLKSQVLHLEEIVELGDKLERAAKAARDKADFYRDCIKQTLSF